MGDNLTSPALSAMVFVGTGLLRAGLTPIKATAPAWTEQPDTRTPGGIFCLRSQS
jgi:hypothetical protein